MSTLGAGATRVPKFAICAAIALVFSLVAFPVTADNQRTQRDGELENWLFSGGAVFGAFGHTAEAQAIGTSLVGPRATNINGIADDVPTVIPATFGEADIRSLTIGPTFGLLTPSLIDIETQPRFFFDISLLQSLPQESTVSKNGQVGEFGVPDGISRAAGFVGERLISGTGNEVSSQHQGLQVHVALGSAFTVDWGDHRFRIKPGIQYSRIENKISAAARRAVRIVNSDPRDPVTRRIIRSLNSYRLIALEDEHTEVFHGLGPSLEIEYDWPEQLGPFRVGLFIQGSGTHLFGDLETEFFKTNPAFPQESVRFSYRNARWAYRAATGIRFHLAAKRNR